MSKEFEASVFGIKFKYKKVGRIPIILEPCKHVIIEEGKMFSNDIVEIHCDTDGVTRYKKIKM